MSMATDRPVNTPKKTAKRSGLKPAWKPGQSGNPNGRPRGARNKLSEKFLDTLMRDFEKHGRDTLVKAREANPVAYVRIVADLMPREFDLGDKTAVGLHGLYGAIVAGAFGRLPRQEGDDDAP
jgi:hypothetical protein